MTTRTHNSIVTRTATLAGLSAATLAMAVVAAAQVPVPETPGGGSGPGGRVGVQVKIGGTMIGSGSDPVHLIMLATQPSVQKDLKLTDTQKQRIAKIEAQLQEKAEQARNEMVPKPDQGGEPQVLNLQMARAGLEKMKQAKQALHSQADAVVIRELQRKQRTRLEQIRIQADGPLAFERPEVLDRLNLDENQIGMIQAILAEGRGQLEQSGGFMLRAVGPGPGPGYGPDPGAGAGSGSAPPSPQDLKKKFSSKEFQDQLKTHFEKGRKETQSVRDRMMQAIGQVLSRGQRASYRKLIGEPFDLKPLRNAAPSISVRTLGEADTEDGDSSKSEPKSDQPESTPKASQNKVEGSKRSGDDG
jgi:hypothetical protein